MGMRKGGENKEKQQPQAWTSAVTWSLRLYIETPRTLSVGFHRDPSFTTKKQADKLNNHVNQQDKLKVW